MKQLIIKLKRIKFPFKSTNKCLNNESNFKPVVQLNEEQIVNMNATWPVLIQVSQNQFDRNMQAQITKLQQIVKEDNDKYDASFFLHMDRYMEDK